MGLSILLERFYEVASQHGQAMQARLCLSIEHAHSMRDPKEALTVAIDRSGVGRTKASQLGDEDSGRNCKARRLPHTPETRGRGWREVSAWRRSRAAENKARISSANQSSSILICTLSSPRHMNTQPPISFLPLLQAARLEAKCYAGKPFPFLHLRGKLS
jgi:hypothetical protein